MEDAELGWSLETSSSSFTRAVGEGSPPALPFPSSRLSPAAGSEEEEEEEVLVPASPPEVPQPRLVTEARSPSAHTSDEREEQKSLLKVHNPSLRLSEIQAKMAKQ